MESGINPNFEKTFLKFCFLPVPLDNSYVLAAVKTPNFIKNKIHLPADDVSDQERDFRFYKEEKRNLKYRGRNWEFGVLPIHNPWKGIPPLPSNERRATYGNQ